MFERIVAGLAQLPERGGAQLPDPGGAHRYTETDVIFWGGILIGVVLVGSVFIMLLRRRLHDRQVSAQDAGFSLSDLRAMRDRGEITPAEYEQTRARVIAKVKMDVGERPKGPPDAAGAPPPEAKP